MDIQEQFSTWNYLYLSIFLFSIFFFPPFLVENLGHLLKSSSFDCVQKLGMI